MNASTIAAGRAEGARLFPGVLASIVVAAAATFLSQHYAAPVMLFALLLGMAMNFLSAEGPCAPGIEFTAKQVLRVGVALLGLRITVAQVANAVTRVAPFETASGPARARQVATIGTWD